MDIHNPERILGRQSRGRCHGVAAMSRDHFLICFEPPTDFSLADASSISQTSTLGNTHAPPELSEPAITRTLPWPITSLEFKTDGEKSRNEGQFYVRALCKPPLADVYPYIVVTWSSNPCTTGRPQHSSLNRFRGSKVVSHGHVTSGVGRGLKCVCTNCSLTGWLA
jgi:hypothetical protein